MAERACRWGILGTAMIARKNWAAIRNTGNSTLVAVASRDLDRARQFIDTCQAYVPFDTPPRACGSYDELINSEDIDALYMPLPTGVRKSLVIRAAEAGKHVVCEKPCGVSTEDVVEMISACESNNVQFMDGVMFMHSARLATMRQVLDDGESIGSIRRIVSHFTTPADDEWLQTNIRTNSDMEPYGCLGDLGWYTIRFSLWAMKERLPEQVTGRVLSEIHREGSPRPTPTEFSGELVFANGVSAGFYCSFLARSQLWATVGGPKGYLFLHDFVVPFYGTESTFDVIHVTSEKQTCEFKLLPQIRRVATPETSSYGTDSQETQLFRTFAERVLSGKLDPSWPRIALNTQRVIHACMQSATSNGAPVPMGN